MRSTPRPGDESHAAERWVDAPEAALAGATPYLRLFGLARGGAGARRGGARRAAALARGGDADPAHAARIAAPASSPRTSPCWPRASRPPSPRAPAPCWWPTRRWPSERRRPGDTLADHVEVARDAGVLRVTLAPEKKNALTGAMYERLVEALREADAIGDRRRAHRRAGGCFTAGNDIGDFLTVSATSRALRRSGSSARSPPARRRWSRRCRDRGRHRGDAPAPLRSRLCGAGRAVSHALRRPRPGAGGGLLAAAAAPRRHGAARRNCCCLASRSTPRRPSHGPRQRRGAGREAAGARAGEGRALAGMPRGAVAATRA